jgi:hypothetical protein
MGWYEIIKAIWILRQTSWEQLLTNSDHKYTPVFQLQYVTYHIGCKKPQYASFKSKQSYVINKITTVQPQACKNKKKIDFQNSLSRKQKYFPQMKQ